MEIEQTVLAWGDVLRGSLVLQGRNVSTLVTDPFHVALGYSVSDEYYPLAGYLLVPGPHTIEPRSEQRFSLRLTIPDTAPIQHVVELKVAPRRQSTTAAAKLLVALTGTDGWWSGPTLKIQVTPPASCRIIATQFGMVTRMQLDRWERSQEGDVVGWFRPLDKRSLFKEGAIMLFGTTHLWCGRLQILRRSRWGLYLDQVCLELPNFPQDPDAIREQFLQVLRNAGFRPEESRDLPIPVDSHLPAANDLPRPVSQATDSTCPVTNPKQSE